jgi:DNA-binding PadR family transcriptional regulator
MMNNISFTDYINDSIRILIIAYTVKDKKSLKLTENKIKLFDYYIKFPKTMFERSEMDRDMKDNFDEYYAFFHWQPDLIRYRRNINYLIAKGLIEKRFKNDDLYYAITDRGLDVLNALNSRYKERMVKLASMLIKDVVKLSDSKIEEEIKRKSNIYLRNNKGV